LHCQCIDVCVLSKQQWKRKRSSWTGVFNLVNISSFSHTHYLIISFCMHAWFHLSITAIERRMRWESSRARVYVVSFTLITSRRLALLHRLTRFLLLLSIIIVASHCALLHFLLKPSSSILARFRFSSSSSASSLHSFIYVFDEQNSNNNTVGNRKAEIRSL